MAPVAKAEAADRVDAAEEERREELLELAEAVRDKVRDYKVTSQIMKEVLI